MPIYILVSLISAGITIGAIAYALIMKKKVESNKETKPKDTKTEDDKNIIEDAEVQVKHILLNAKEEAIKLKELAEQEATGTRKRLMERERKIDQRQTELSRKTKEMERKDTEVTSLKRSLEQKKSEVETLRLEQVNKLESVASMTKSEAKKLILANIEKTLDNEIAKKIKEAEETYKAKVDSEAKELLIETMHSASTDYVAEYTISKVKLKDKDLKGKIIGKEGRNIRAFEDATGVSVNLEEGEEITLSSFDSVRREIARISLERLLKDGRIHPARIEEVIAKTSTEMEKVLYKAGEELCNKVGVYNLPKEIVTKLGHFKYRTSYGQNMIQHTLEETQMGVKLAKELGIDVKITKLACLLHDIGKVVTDKEGSHIELGAEYLRSFNMPKEVIIAVEEHHMDKPSTLPGILVQIADSISGSRPGARYEDYENYVKRLKALEETAMSHKGVAKAFAISAGRELRVIINPEDLTDAQAVKLSHDLAEQIQKEQTYPGTVKVIVIRETRALTTAK